MYIYICDCISNMLNRLIDLGVCTDAIKSVLDKFNSYDHLVEPSSEEYFVILDIYFCIRSFHNLFFYNAGDDNV